MNGRRISVRSLCYYMLRKAWLILLMAVCCGALLAGYKYYKDSKSETGSGKESNGSTLTEQERSDVDNAALQYRYAKELEIYLEESPLLQMNSKGEDQTIVEYRISLDLPQGETSYGTVENSYLQLLRAYINDGLFIGDLVKKSSEYEKHTYLKELVWCNNSGGGEFTLGVLHFDVYPNLEQDVRGVVEAYMADLMQKENRLRIEPMKEGKVTLYDSTTDSTQKTSYSNMVTYRKAYMNAYTGFNSTQQSYFRYLTGYMKEDTAKTKEVKISRRYLVIGVFGGAVAGLCLCFILLYLSLKHASPLDYSENLGLRNFGLLGARGKKRHPVREWFIAKEFKNAVFSTNEESVEYAAVRIGAFCDNHKIDRLAVLSSDSTAVVQQAVSQLQTALRKQEVDLISTERVSHDSEALSALIQTGHCILVEQIRGGNRQKSAELLQFCRENDVEVIGALGVAELTR